MDQLEFDEEQQIDSDFLEGNKLQFTTINKHIEDPRSCRNIDDGRSSEDQSIEYVWEKIIGQGTFGVVYKVKEKSTGRIYAIKKVFQDPKYSNREFKIVVMLDHPNCIKVHKYFFSGAPDSKEVYLNLLMDYVPDTLYKILRFYSKKAFPFPNALGKIYSY